MKDTTTSLIKPFEISVERYVAPSGIDYEEAKRLCEESGVVWEVLQ